MRAMRCDVHNQKEMKDFLLLGEKEFEDMQEEFDPWDEEGGDSSIVSYNNRIWLNWDL